MLGALLLLLLLLLLSLWPGNQSRPCDLIHIFFVLLWCNIRGWLGAKYRVTLLLLLPSRLLLLCLLISVVNRSVFHKRWLERRFICTTAGRLFLAPVKDEGGGRLRQTWRPVGGRGGGDKGQRGGDKRTLYRLRRRDHGMKSDGAMVSSLHRCRSCQASFHSHHHVKLPVILDSVKVPSPPPLPLSPHPPTRLPLH